MFIVLNKFYVQKKLISVFLLFSIFFIPVGLLADFSEEQLVTNSNKITVSKSKPELPTSETKQILDYLKWQNHIVNSTADLSAFIRQLEAISKKSKEYYIPVNITHRLMEISLLHNEAYQNDESQSDWRVRKTLMDSGIPLHQLKEGDRTSLIKYIISQNETYNEQQRSFAVITLGEIGQRQMLPPNVVRSLRALMFETKNPNVRLAVIQTFGKISLLHPPEQETLRQMAEYIKHFHEENRKPPRVFIQSLEHELFYKSLQMVAQNRFFPISLIQALLIPLSNPADDLKRIDFLQNTLLPLAQQNQWPRTTLAYLEKQLLTKQPSFQPSQNNKHKENYPSQCRVQFYQ